jgi:hypothetical protein
MVFDLGFTQTEKVFQAESAYLTALNGTLDCALWFMAVGTVMKPTLANIGSEFGKTLLQFLTTEVGESEAAYTGRVDQFPSLWRL